MAGGERVLIIGGGIGGLAMANGLQRRGMNMAVYERAPELAEIGAGLGVQSNAAKALRSLGRAEEVLAHGCEVETYEGLALGKDRLLVTWPQGDISRRMGAPTVVVHRVDLLNALAGGIDASTLNMRKECIGYEEDDAGVTARFADGSEERGELLIGADGIRSAVRAQLVGDQPIRYAGFVVWRAITTFAHPKFPIGVMRNYDGRGRVFGMWHLQNGRVFWIASAKMPPNGNDAPGGRKKEIQTWFAHAQSPIPELIEATPEELILRNDTIDRPPISSWSSRRVVLMGDAAHAMIQVTGQGAGQAIEDAAVLSKRLGELDKLSDGDALRGAIAAYEANRIPRVTEIANEAWKIGMTLHWSNPIACFLRDLAFRTRPKSQWVKQMETRLSSFQED